MSSQRVNKKKNKPSAEGKSTPVSTWVEDPYGLSTVEIIEAQNNSEELEIDGDLGEVDVEESDAISISELRAQAAAETETPASGAEDFEQEFKEDAEFTSDAGSETEGMNEFISDVGSETEADAGGESDQESGDDTDL